MAGSSSVLLDESYILIYAVGYYNNDQDVYLLRYENNMLLDGNPSDPSFWVVDRWVNGLNQLPGDAVLFKGQTEFSVHYEESLNKYIQIQTIGFGQVPLGYRMAEQPQGPWKDLVVFYMPEFGDKQEFIYSANAHPELISDGLIITFNINNFDFGKLIANNKIYFPNIISLKF